MVLSLVWVMRDENNVYFTKEIRRDVLHLHIMFCNRWMTGSTERVSWHLRGRVNYVYS